ncbi:MAG TPA: hypothetical protein VGT61_04790 [Thermomicrobiales bacterium]|jgi:hypothetical protein|nr:hypothetical protein [Thermomicrobiales bacterium]
MSHWPTVPTMVLCTRSARILPVRAHAEAAEQAGLPGVDLDLGSRAFPVFNHPGTPPANHLERGRIDSLWLPTFQPSGFGSRHLDKLLERWNGEAGRLGVRSIVVDRDVALRPVGSKDKRPVLLRLREGVPAGVRIVVVLRPRSLEGTRLHLNSLVTLRRTAEEWDFDLGVDLLGPVDQRWEAEAAIQRLLTRLALVRIPSIAHDRQPAPRNRITSRVVAYLLDQGYQGTLSLTARLRPTDLMRPSALGIRAEAETRAIVSRHQRLYGGASQVPPILPPRQARARGRS